MAIEAEDRRVIPLGADDSIIRKTELIIGGVLLSVAVIFVVLALLLLLATPVVRVAVSIIAFAMEEERTYVIITALVLAILLFIVFGIVLRISAMPLVMRLGEELPETSRTTNGRCGYALPSTYPDGRAHHDVSYSVAYIRRGFSLMYVAGVISGLLGIGIGIGTFKVLARRSGWF